MILSGATDTLRASYRILMNSSILGFFAEQQNKSAGTAFEQCQQELETVTTELTQLLQQHATSSSWLYNVQDTSIRVQEMCRLLLSQAPTVKG